MPILLSRALVAFEASFILLPVTFYSVFFGAVLIGISFRDDSGYDLFLAIVVALVLLSLIAGWVLSVGFIFRGVSALKTLGGFWFYLAFLGVVITLCSLPIALFDPDSSLGVFAFGSPALILFLHLLAEKRLRKTVD